MKKKTFKENKKVRIFLINRNFLAPQKKIFKYCVRYWKKKIKMKCRRLKAFLLKRVKKLQRKYCFPVINFFNNFKNGMEQRVQLFKTTNLNLSFKPVLFLQGTAVFVFTLCVLFAGNWFFSPKPQISQSQVIKTTITKQASSVVAEKTVKWSVIVKKSDITESTNLVQLPKSAKNIKVKTITKKTAEDVLTKDPAQTASQLTIDDRKQLVSPPNFLSSFVAGLLSKFSKFFLAGVQQAVKDVLAQQEEPQTEIHPEIIETSEAVFVDLSSLALPTNPESADAESADAGLLQEISPEQETPNVEETPSEEIASPSSDDSARNDEEVSNDVEDVKVDDPSLREVPTAVADDEAISQEQETPAESTESPEVIAPMSEIGEASPETEIIQFPEIPLIETTTPSNQEVLKIEQIEQIDEDEPFDDTQDEYVQIDYETPAPVIKEQKTKKGKIVRVSSADEDEKNPITNVLAFTTIPEIYKVGQENRIKVVWKNNPSTGSGPGGADQEMEFHAYDLNENGKLDYVEWTVPHLSEQIFEIIFISKAFELDENFEIVADIYDLTVTKDNQWATVPNNHYVRATFEQVLDNTKDITLYARPATAGTSPEPTGEGQASSIEVYPVYTDADGNTTEGPIVATFENIDQENTYKIYLTNLTQPTDVFDLKIVNGDIDIDQIVDPDPVTWTSQRTGNWSVLSGTESSPWYDAGAQAALNAIPAATDTVHLAHAVVMDGDLIPASGSLAVLDATGGSLTVVMGANDKTLNATAITAGAVDLVNVSGAAPTKTLTVNGNITGGSSAGADGLYHNSTASLAIVGDITGGSEALTYGLRNESTATVTVTGNALGATSGSVRNVSTGTITITGNVTGGGANSYGAYNVGTGTVAIIGTVTGGGGSGAYGVLNKGILTITGAILGGTNSSAYGVYNDTNGTITQTGGTITAATAPAAYNASTGTINLTGAVTGSATAAAYGVFNNSTGPINIVGDVTGGDSATARGVYNYTTATITITGSILGGSNSTAYGVYNAGAGTITQTGGTITGATAVAAYNAGAGTINLTGAVTAGANTAVANATNGTINIVGNVSGYSTAYVYGVWNGTGAVNITGNVVGGSATETFGIKNYSTGLVTITGAIAGGSHASAYGVYNTAGGTITQSGGTITAAVGVAAYNAGAGTINLTGAVTGSATTGTNTVYNVGSGTVNIVGNVTGGDFAGANGVRNYAGGSVNITGSITGGTGSASSYGVNNISTGTITQTGGTITGATGHAAYNQGAGTINLTGAVTGSATAAAYGADNHSTGTIAIVGAVTGGDFKGAYGATNYSTGTVNVTGAVTGNASGVSTGVINNAGGTITINGNVTGGGVAASRGVFNYGNSGYVTIIGNITGGSATEAYGVHNFAGGTITQTGGTITGATAIAAYNQGTGTINLTGAVTGGATAAAYGAYNYNSGLITITGAILGGSHASAYGVYNRLGGTITQTGGTITGATAVAAYNVGAGTINLTGAVTGSASAEAQGAYNASIGTINIVGAVTGGAFLSAYGAYNNAGGTVAITGNVAGTTGGGVRNSSTGLITITGSIAGGGATTQYAYGAYNAVGGTITQTGGTITAVTASAVYNAGVGTINLTGAVTGSATVARHGAHNFATGTITITGNVTGGAFAASYGAYNNADGGVIIINGSITGSANATAVYNNGAGTVTVTGGPVTGGSGAGFVGIYNKVAGAVTITGNVVGGSNATAYGIRNNATGPITITGDITKATANPILNSSTGTITLSGTANQAVEFGGAMGYVIVNKPTSGNITWTSGDTITAGGAWSMTTLTEPAGVTIDFNGQTIATTGDFTISAGADVSTTNLGGSTINVGGNFSANGSDGDLLTLNPASTWYLNVTGTGTASYANVAYSDASGGTKIDALDGTSTDGNNNTNWDFDVTPPTTIADAGSYTFGEASSSNVTVTLICADGLGSGCLSTVYCTDTENTCIATTPYATPFSVSTEGSSYVRFYSIDNAGKTESVNSEMIVIEKVVAGGGGGIIVPWSPPEQPEEPEEPEEPTPPEPPTQPEDNTNIIDSLTQQINNLLKQINEFPKKLTPAKKPGDKIVFPPIEQTVTQETPESLQRKWNLVQQKRFEEISILPLPDEIKQLALDFPKFQTTLEKVGIKKPEDIEKLKVAKLSFPGLAEALGRETANMNPSDFKIQEKIQMVTNFVFARVTEDKIDFNTKVSFSENDEVIKSITTIQNKPLYLVVKPDKPAKKVTGYIIFKSVSSEKALQEFADNLSPALSASLLDAFTLPPKENQDESAGQEVEVKKELVLNKFEYEDLDGDGIYTATITSPPVAGKYEIKTVIDYKDPEQSPRELNMIMVVDPEGYVYEKTSDNKETRIKGAVATIYWLNPETKQFELWPANDFQQENPQTTDNTGKYSFLVPEGYYYLEVKADGYIPYKGEPFEVQEGLGIHTNIELKIADWWQRIFTIERVMLGLIVILLLAMLIALAIIIFKKRNQISM